jgi:predicted Kef-type K+ transport protein
MEGEVLDLKKIFKDIRAELSVGKLVGVLIFVVIAMALLPTIIEATDAGYTDAGEDYASAATLIQLVPLFYVIAILVSVIVWVVHETQGMGG